MNYITVIALCWLTYTVGNEIEKPVPKFEIFRPSGIRVSVPHVNGLSEFFFWANINIALEGKDLGSIRLKTYEPTNGEWMIEDMNVKLNPGDTIYYTFFVNINNSMHMYQRQQYTVEEVVELPSTTPKAAILSCLDGVWAIHIDSDGMTVVRKNADGSEQKEIIQSIHPITVVMEKGRIEFGKQQPTANNKC